MEDRIKNWLLVDFGSGYSSGDGSGYGDGSGLKTIDNKVIYNIDGVQTIIKSLKNNIAKGFIVNNDLTFSDCYVAKIGNNFAHGKTIKAAVKDAKYKHFDSLPVEEKIKEFCDKFEKSKEYKAKEFYKWHGFLTNSCTMGRDCFIKNHDINLSNTMTVDEFIKLTENEYGGEIIEMLKENFVEDGE